VIDELKPVQRQLKERLGTNFAFLGDEIYLRAGRSVPDRYHYGDYPQIEDGVGMVRAFHGEFASLIRKLKRGRPTQLRKKPGTIITGTLFFPVLRQLIDKLNSEIDTRLTVTPIINNYFGRDVSVAGLLTGGDVCAAREGITGEFLLIPKQMLKSDEAIMLDGMTLGELQSRLKIETYAVGLNDLAEVLSSVSSN
jgi:NifB/MoaA-like Fe-S oxidoreductase